MHARRGRGSDLEQSLAFELGCMGAVQADERRGLETPVDAVARLLGVALHEALLQQLPLDGGDGALRS